MPSKLPLVYFESQTKVLGIGIQQNEEQEKSISGGKNLFFFQLLRFYINYKLS